MKTEKDSTRKSVLKWVIGRLCVTGAFFRQFGALKATVLACAAAVAFTALLRWHNNRFRADMVNTFQQHRSAAANSLAGTLESGFSEIVRGLVVAGNHPELKTSPDGPQSVIAAYMERNKDTLNRVFLADSDGEIDWQFPELNDKSAESRIDIPKSSYWDDAATTYDRLWYVPSRDGKTIRVATPVRTSNGIKAIVGCDINVSRLLAKCLVGSGEVPYTLCWVVGQNGRVITETGRGLATTGGPGTDGPKSGPLHIRHRKPIIELVDAQSIGLGRSGTSQVGSGDEQALIAFSPVLLGDRRYGLVLGASKSSVSVPLNAHERVTYALIGALALLYFVAGYTVYRGDSDRIQLEKQRRLMAEAASRAKNEFLAKMSHEIRTPMNGVLGMTELVLETDLTDRQRKCLQMAKSSAGSLLAIINDILDISKIEAGKMELVCEQFRLRDCLRDAIGPFEQQAQDKAIGLSLRIGEDVPDLLVGDQVRLRQVMINLLGNAIKFTKNGSITAGVLVDSREDKNICLSFNVTDTGIGISPDRKNKIFSAFEQADNSISGKYGGTGLGLTISAQLVEMMGGRISVESREGQGSTFSFTAQFTLADENTTEKENRRVSQAGRSVSSLNAADGKREPAGDGVRVAGPEHLKILLAEDNYVNREHATMLLGKYGHEVVCAETGVQAVSMHAKESFDLILMDMQMPEMDGPEATVAIRESEKGTNRHVPIIAMTANAMDIARQQCRDAGMDGYVSKPVSGKVLLQTIHEVMERCSATASQDVSCSKDEESHLENQSGKLVFDVDLALEHVDGDRDSLVRLAKVFLADCPGILADLHLAMERRDGAALKKLGHRLKGSLALLGAVLAVEFAEKLEVLAESGDWGPAVEASSGLEGQIEAMQRLLDDLIREKKHASPCSG